MQNSIFNPITLSDSIIPMKIFFLFQKPNDVAPILRISSVKPNPKKVSSYFSSILKPTSSVEPNTKKISKKNFQYWNRAATGYLLSANKPPAVID